MFRRQEYSSVLAIATFFLAACNGDVGAADEPAPVHHATIDATEAVDGSAAIDTATPADSSAIDSSAPPDTASAPDTQVDTTSVDSGCPATGTLKIGATFVVEVDAHTGIEETTEPKKDANDGKAGDVPFFRRTNVARAHTFGASYWFTSKHQEAGEPDPKGDQWVDYVPPLTKLGAGRYRITAEYRQSENRADYDALYVVTTASGTTTTIKRDQRLGKDITSFDLGEHDLGCTGFVRVRDTGADSISFGKMTFEYRGK